MHTYINNVYFTKSQGNKDRREQRLLWEPVLEKQGVTEKQRSGKASHREQSSEKEITPHSKIKDKPRTLTVPNEELSHC